MKVVSTNGWMRRYVEGYNRGNPSSCRGTMQVIYRDNMLAVGSWRGCGCRFEIPSGRSRNGWDTIGLAGCSDNSNENTLLQLGQSNSGGYYHNRNGCMRQNGFGSYGNCDMTHDYGGAMIFVKQAYN